jgi:hypothetical protein
VLCIVGLFFLRLCYQLQVAIAWLQAEMILVIHASGGIIIQRSKSVQGMNEQNKVAVKKTQA